MENKLFKKIVPAGVGVIIENERGEFLLGKRNVENGKNKWATPGGFLEPNEALESSARREVLEETGYKLDNLKYLGITMIVGKNESFLDVCFLAKVDSAGLKKVCEIKDIECDEWLWISKDKIKELDLWKPAEAIFKLYFDNKNFYEEKDTL